MIGEEACDVDTIVSSIVYAFYRTKLDGEKLFVPLLNCRPQQLRLKSELVAILRRDALGELLLVYVFISTMSCMHALSLHPLKIVVALPQK